MGLYYFDLIIDEVEEMAMPVLMNQALSVVHGGIKSSVDKIAIAFPDIKGKKLGRNVRLFAQSFSALDAIKESIRSHFFIRDYTSYSTVHEVDDNFDGPWCSYQRFRIPTNKSLREGSELKNKRIRLAKGLPFIVYKSLSNGNTFKMRVKTVRHNSYNGNFIPNGYGLSGSDNPVLLPCISSEA